MYYVLFARDNPNSPLPDDYICSWIKAPAEAPASWKPVDDGAFQVLMNKSNAALAEYQKREKLNMQTPPRKEIVYVHREIPTEEKKSWLTRIKEAYLA